jgi:hypothetical protein
MWRAVLQLPSFDMCDAARESAATARVAGRFRGSSFRVSASGSRRSGPAQRPRFMNWHESTACVGVASPKRSLTATLPAKMPFYSAGEGAFGP